jgi:large subunit ribosomal protein L21
MYAVINSGGKQYRLSEGDLIDLERLDGEIGDQIVFDQVLLVENDESPLIGTPTVDGAQVVGTIVEQGKGDKIVVFKFKRRKMYRRRTGHRQLLTTVKIDSIEAPGKAKVATKKAAPVEKKKIEKKAETPAEAKASAKEAAKKTKKVESGSKQAEKVAASTKKAEPGAQEDQAAGSRSKKASKVKSSEKAAPKKTAKKSPAATKSAKPSAGKKAAAGKAKSAEAEAKPEKKESDSAKETE